MNVHVKTEQAPKAQQKLGIIDCDMHPRTTPADLRPFMSNHWWNVMQTYGVRPRHGFAKATMYPKSQPQAARLDAWPPSGGPPCSDLDFVRQQHLDAYGIDYGIMLPLGNSGQGARDPELSAAITFACNEALIQNWTSRDKRLKGSIVVPYEDGEASRVEIDRRAGNADFVQVQLLSRTSEPLGKKRYWPIYAAACEHNLPVAIHVFGASGWASTNGGWASFYVEEMTEHAVSAQAIVMSLIMEGVFEQFPTLKIVLIESGFGWLPALGWRLDKIWKRLRDEVPHLKRAPSEYIREHIWVTTQPMEEPNNPRHVVDVMEWIGWDHVLFATDYPHWDFDNPQVALAALDLTRRQQVLSENARQLYRF